MSAQDNVSSIQAAPLGIGFALRTKSLSVPVYQRAYAWKDDDAKTFVDDILRALKAGKAEYFLGTVVAIENKLETKSEIVDGQQRLATAAIMFATIRDIVHQIAPNKGAKFEQEYLFSEALFSESIQPKLRLSNTDHEFFTRHILARPGSVERLARPKKSDPVAKESHRLMCDAAKACADGIDNYLGDCRNDAEKKERLEGLVDFLVMRTRVIWVSVTDESSAFTIFETLNNRGADLSLADLLKNHLLKTAGRRQGEALQRWTEMVVKLEEMGDGSSTVDYIRHLWASRKGSTPERALFDEFKGAIVQEADAIRWADDLNANATLYAAITNPEHVTWTDRDPTAREQLATMNLLELAQNRPLLLAVLEMFKGAELTKALRVLVSWGVRFLVNGRVNRGGALEAAYSRTATAVRSKTIKNARELAGAEQIGHLVPNDQVFRKDFGAARISKPKTARYYLAVLEQHLARKKDPTRVELVPSGNTDVVNLEHILPQVVVDQASWAHIPDADAKSHYNRLGNMTLLSYRSNSALNSASFELKKKEYAKSKFELNRYFSKVPQWTADEIERRQEKLAELAVRAWPLNTSEPVR